MKHLMLAVAVLGFAACNAEGSASNDTQQDVPQIVGNADQAEETGAAPPGNPMLGQLGEMGGGAEAANELCSLGIDTAAAKREQQANFTRMGGTQAQFEAAYQTGYDRAKAQFEAASAGDRERMCEDYKNLQSQMEASM